jgi:PEP-CTERM motif-containing protein
MVLADIPEPGSVWLALIGGGFAAAGFFGKRMRRR